MKIDEARCHHSSVCIDHPARRIPEGGEFRFFGAQDLPDHPVTDQQLRPSGGGTGSIQDPAIHNEKVRRRLIGRKGDGVSVLFVFILPVALQRKQRDEQEEKLEHVHLAEIMIMQSDSALRPRFRTLQERSTTLLDRLRK